MGLKAMSSAKKVLTGIGCILLLGAICFVAGLFWAGRDAQPVITSELISQKLAPVSELATVSYSYTNMGKFENSLDFYGWTVPLTQKRFIISYKGVMKAGLDASQIQVAIDEQAKRITLTLPQAQILSHAIDENSIEVFDESTNIFNPIRITDYTQFSTDQKAEVEADAIADGLLDQAVANAKTAITQFLLLSDSIAEQYEIQFA